MDKQHGKAHHKLYGYCDAVSYLAGDFIEEVALADAAQKFSNFLRLRRGDRHALLAMFDLGGAAAEGAADWLRTRLQRGDTPVPNFVKHFMFLLRRLPREPMGRGQYRMLAEAVEADPRLARHLSHVDDLAPERIAAAVALPEPLRHSSVIRLVPEKSFAKKVSWLFRLAVRDGRNPVDLANAVCAATDMDGLEQVLRKAVTGDALPLGPFAGDDELVPICTGSELRALGEAMSNCLGRFSARYAARGNVAFYLWRQPRVCVALERDRFGWIIDQWAGDRNAQVEEPVKRAIMAKLELVGIEQRPCLDDLLTSY